MQKVTTLLIALTMVVGLSACKKKKEEAKTDPAKPADPAMKPADPAGTTPDKPADKPADPPAAGGAIDEAKAVATMENLGKVFAAAGKDCKKLATVIKKLAYMNKDKLIAMKDWEAKQTPEQKKAMEERYKPQMEAMMKNMMGAMQACAEDKDVEAAMKELPLE